MARQSGIWLRKRDGFWMTTVQGVQHKLSRDKGEAQKKFYRLMGTEETPKARKGASAVSVRKLCDLYLVGTRENKKDETHDVQVWHLKRFTAAFGHRDPAALKVHEVTAWLDAQQTWGTSTKALVVTILKAAFNWGVDESYLDANPIKKLRRRKTERRERVLTADERERVRAAVSPGFRDYLTVLEMTGCRPYSEAANLTAADIDWANGRAILRRHKNAKKGKTRTVYFPPALLALLKGLKEKWPTGPLLRNRLGQAWVGENVGHYIRRVYRRLGIEPFVAYSYRATFITDALVKGIPVEVVAELVGSSPKVIWAHYASVAKKPEAMQAAAAKAVS